MDSNQRRKSQLNLPAGMNQTSLHLDKFPANFPAIPNTVSPSKTTYSDRFIPCRTSSRLQEFSLLEKSSPVKEGGNDVYTRLLKTELFGVDPVPCSPSAQSSPMSPNKNLFRFKTDHSAPSSPFSQQFSSCDAGVSGEASTPPRAPRKISKTPHKVLDAPSLQDDFYLNLVDWSSQNVLAVGLGTCVYLWSASNSKVTKLCDLGPSDSVCAIQWTREGSYLAIGTHLGEVQATYSSFMEDEPVMRCFVLLCKTATYSSFMEDEPVMRCFVLLCKTATYSSFMEDEPVMRCFVLLCKTIWDGAKCRRVRAMGGHQTRSGVLAWSSCILSSGSRDRNILQHDIRVPHDFVSKLVGHKSEVCGLKWSHDDRELASGGNDNQLLVWNQHSQQPLLKLTEHTAAVKAIAWSPHQHSLLASGGGTADRCIRFWNTSNSNQLNCVDTGSQVCNLVWCKNVNELVSTHGYSQNQIMVWKYPSMGKVATLTGHSMRVLYLAISPDGQMIVTGAGDETLRFWNIFPSVKTQTPVRDSVAWSLGRSHIR